MFPEDPAEIAAVSQTAGMADICNGILPVYEHFAGFLQTVTLDVLYGRRM